MLSNCVQDITISKVPIESNGNGTTVSYVGYAKKHGFTTSKLSRLQFLQFSDQVFLADAVKEAKFIEDIIESTFGNLLMQRNRDGMLADFSSLLISSMAAFLTVEAITE